MYDEVAPRRKGAFWQVLLIVTVGFILLSLPQWLSSFFSSLPYSRIIYEFAVFALGAVAVLSLMRRYSVEYHYVLISSQFLIKAKTGTKESILANLEVDRMISLSRLPEASSDLTRLHLRPRKISVGVSRPDQAYLLLYRVNDQTEGLIFQPSEEFVKLLQQKILDISSEK